MEQRIKQRYTEEIHREALSRYGVKPGQARSLDGFESFIYEYDRDGQAYTESEYHTWFVEAGFVAFERLVMPGGASIITARKPH